MSTIMGLGSVNSRLMDCLGIDLETHCFIMITDSFGVTKNTSNTGVFLHLGGESHMCMEWTSIEIPLDTLSAYGIRELCSEFFNNLVDICLIESWTPVEDVGGRIVRLSFTPFYDVYKKLMCRPMSDIVESQLLAYIEGYKPSSMYDGSFVRDEVKEQKEEETGNVYLMKNHRNGYTKIGYTKKNPKYREKTLQSEEPEISLIKQFKGKWSDEQRLHEIYSDKRLRGEWFDLDSSDVSEIEEYFRKAQ